MNQPGFLERIKSGRTLVSDGATGTNLQQRGLAAGKPGELWVVERTGEIARCTKSLLLPVRISSSPARSAAHPSAWRGGLG